MRGFKIKTQLIIFEIKTSLTLKRFISRIKMTYYIYNLDLVFKAFKIPPKCPGTITLAVKGGN